MPTIGCPSIFLAVLVLYEAYNHYAIIIIGRTHRAPTVQIRDTDFHRDACRLGLCYIHDGGLEASVSGRASRDSQKADLKRRQVCMRCKIRNFIKV